MELFNPGATLDEKAVIRALGDNGTLATVLHVIALRSYGTDIYEWDPVALFLHLEEDFGVKITEENESKINAILLAVSTNVFYEQPGAFRAIANTLMDGDPGLEGFDDLTLPEIFWAMYEIAVNRDHEDFQPAVAEFVDKEIADEIDDPEYGPDPYGYLKSFLYDRKNDLRRQMEDLGIESVELPELQLQSN